MRLGKILLACGLALGLMGFGVVVVIMGMLSAASTNSGSSWSTECSTTLLAGGAPTQLDAEQGRNARTIVQTGLKLRVPPKGLVIALATAMQESSLKNLSYGDRDSVGLFQQRAAWGSTEERMNPETSARMFFTGGRQGQPGLLDKANWKSQPVTVAAQSVQVSAFPMAYKRWEPVAIQTVRELLKGADPRSTASVASDHAEPGEFACGQVAGEQLPAGSIGAMLRSALAERGVPYVWGGTTHSGLDCSGLVVHAWRKTGFQVKVRTSQQMYANSDRVEASAARPGDLVFNHFQADGPGHVMIVVNKDWVLQAPHTGDVVKLTPFDPQAAGQTIGRLKSEVLAPLPE